MSARLLARVERLVTDRFGQGAAVEIGTKRIGPARYYVCTVWYPDGVMALLAETAPDGDTNTRTGVLRLMLNQLQAEEVRT